MKITNLKLHCIFLLSILILGSVTKDVLAQDSASVLYIPLIGLTSVPAPLALPKGPGNVTYNYAVKNFLSEVPLTDIQVVDDKCNIIKFITGDDNHDSKLDHNETWRYRCTTKLSETTQSTATATGTANNLIATHKAYATVVVGSSSPPPLVSIINITKVAYPLSLPKEGGKITFTYKVNNPGVVPLSDVVVTDNKCKALSGKLGDTNSNSLLDIHEVWIYTCTTTLKETTTNTVNVTAFANGLKAVDNSTITVRVDIPKLPNTSETNSISKIKAWGILSGILVILLIFLVLTRGKRSKKTMKKLFKLILIVTVLFAGVILVVYRDKSGNTIPDNAFGWKFPVAKFPLTGPNGNIAYSDIRDPGGIPQGLPVQLKIPIIGVDTVIEDAFITSDRRMDVPAGTINVAWFALGPHPGRVGSAVIGGHFGVDNGIPKAFFNLNKLKIGDKVYIVDDKGETLAFIVRSTKSFDRNADTTTVFTSGDGLAHLNLITCEGIWNQVNDTYPERLVIFTDAIPGEGAVVVKPKLPSTAVKNIPSASPSPMVTPTSSPIPQVVMQSAKNLYATPMDGIITTLLLVSIAFVVLKIIKQ